MLTHNSDLNSDHTTPVKIQLTRIKCLDEKNNEVIMLDSYGKLNITESKKLATSNGLVFITKELINNVHNVKTSELLKLL